MKMKTKQNSSRSLCEKKKTKHHTHRALTNSIKEQEWKKWKKNKKEFSDMEKTQKFITELWNANVHGGQLDME